MLHQPQASTCSIVGHGHVMVRGTWHDIQRTAKCACWKHTHWPYYHGAQPLAELDTVTLASRRRYIYDEKSEGKQKEVHNIIMMKNPKKAGLFLQLQD